MNRWSLNPESDYPCAIHGGACIDLWMLRVIRIPRDQFTVTVKVLGFGLSVTRWSA